MNAIMTSRQAAELDFALERNCFDAQDVKKMSEGDFLAKVHDVLHGFAEIKQIAKWYRNKDVIYFTVSTRNRIYQISVVKGKFFSSDYHKIVSEVIKRIKKTKHHEDVLKVSYRILAMFDEDEIEEMGFHRFILIECNPSSDVRIHSIGSDSGTGKHILRSYSQTVSSDDSESGFVFITGEKDVYL